jgi:teichuronic acid biosynthesis glycosyltransferase TuaC
MYPESINKIMRILILSKRQYMNRDLINDRYGRFRELPLALASAGHEVTGICLSYRPCDEGRIDDVENNAKVVWHLLNFKRLLPWSSKSYWRIIDAIGRDFRPDLVWACSDAIHTILGVRIARILDAPLVIDLYDNFESYPATRIPGITSAFRRSLRCADGITCVSRPLAQYIRETSSCTCPIEIIENAVPEGLFHQMDKADARRELELPLEGIFIGTAGAISKSRGIETLLRSFEILAQERSDIHLVLAGSCDKGLILPRNSRVHYLGMLPPGKVPVLLSSLNVSVICNRESAFGKYCFPQKFYESVSCGIPVVAAATGSMQELLKYTPEHLFEPDNVDNLVSVLRRQIDNPVALQIDVPTWTTRGNQLEDFFLACLKAIDRQQSLRVD